MSVVKRKVRSKIEREVRSKLRERFTSPKIKRVFSLSLSKHASWATLHCQLPYSKLQHRYLIPMVTHHM